MLFPSDHQERIQKQKKTRIYKAMLDEQIRQNNLYSQLNKDRRRLRAKTQPYESSFDGPNNKQSQQLAHQSTFLPSIDSNKHIPTRDYSRMNHRRHNSNNHLNKLNNKIVDDSDIQIEKCLQECGQIINGLNKNFIHIKSHFRQKQFRKRNVQIRELPKSLNMNYAENRESQFENYLTTPKKNSFDYSRGKNNLQKNKSHVYLNNDEQTYQKLEQTIDRQYPKYSPITHQKKEDDAEVRSYSNKTDKLNRLSNTSKNSAKKSLQQQFDTINSNNEFMLNSRQKYENELEQSREQKDKKLQKQIAKIKEEEESRIKNISVLEHLKKAKTRGSLLFKKIEMFKKQREGMKKQNNQQDEGMPQRTEKTVLNSSFVKSGKQQKKSEEVNKRQTNSRLSSKSTTKK